MRYEPTGHELNEIAGMVAQQRMHYFLTRTVESEEVWVLADPQGWVMRDDAGKTILSVWPYRQFAEDCADSADLRPHATSLDHFIESVMLVLVSQGVYIEVLPTRQQGGILIAAAELLEIFEGLVDSGEYYLEG